MKHTWKMLERIHSIIKVASQIASFSTLKKILSIASAATPPPCSTQHSVFEQDRCYLQVLKNGPKQHSNPSSKVKLLDLLSKKKVIQALKKLATSL